MWPKLMALLGLYAPVATGEQAIEKAMRRASAASYQHGKITDRARSAALDAFHQQETDGRADEMLRRSDALRETLAAVAERAGRTDT